MPSSSAGYEPHTICRQAPPGPRDALSPPEAIPLSRGNERADAVSLHRASGSGRSWNFTTFGLVPLPVSAWNGVRVP
jgi:hypothetical protein